MALPQTRVARYATALREGGSLPALVETTEGDTVVAKWRGAGQGAAALVAEVIVGELARAVGLPMPRLCTVTLDEAIAKNERHDEIRDLLFASLGLNLGMEYLRGALTYDPGAQMPVSGALATQVVIFDAFTMNVDRTPRNPNLMWWNGGLWLIDHGAALYWHHGWDGVVDRPDRPFPLVREHVLLPQVSDVEAHGSALLGALSFEVIESAVGSVPDAWLPEDADARRRAYVEFLLRRRDANIIEEVTRAREDL